MAKVFRGKVMMPSDKIEDYLKALETAEKEREPFRKYLQSLNEEFREYLSKKYSERTSRKYSGIVDMFMEFLCLIRMWEKIKDITRGIANIHFRQWYKRKPWGSFTSDNLKVALKNFFQPSLASCP